MLLEITKLVRISGIPRGSAAASPYVVALREQHRQDSALSEIWVFLILLISLTTFFDYI